MKTESLELAVIDTQNAVQVFTGGGMAAILDGIEAKVRAIKLDPSTSAGREDIRSVAYKIARTKTALDAEGKKLTEGWREATAKVNAERKKSADRLEALQEEVRKPLTEFESKEKLRVAAHEAALQDITGLHAVIAASPNIGLEELLVHQRELSEMLSGYQWEEFKQRADAARVEAEKYISARIESREKLEAEREELERLRRAEAERLQRERDEKLKAEAAESARLQAERKAKAEADAEAKRVIEAAERERKRVADEAARVRSENERAQKALDDIRRKEEQAKIAAEKRAEESEAARLKSEQKAKADREESEARAAAELKAARDKAKRDSESAVARERERVERERKSEMEARAKREADEALRLRIRAEIMEDLSAAVTPVDAIMDGRVRHVKVVF